MCGGTAGHLGTLSFVEGHRGTIICTSKYETLWDTEGICKTKRDTVGHRTIVWDTEGQWGTLRTDTEGLHGSLGNTEEF